MASEAADPAPALRVVGLTKSFGGRRVVDAVELAVPRGSLFGVVGPNGAGKTTLLSMATGLLRPDGGSCEILGVDVWPGPARPRPASACCRTAWRCPSG